MIELKQDELRFTFPEVHAEASLSIEFQRTLRIPDDDCDHFLPPGLGRFPLRHVDDHAARVPGRWLEHGGVMLPMFQSEALWINFGGGSLLGGESYPCAIKIATGKVNAITGEAWNNELGGSPQDYVVTPEQPWLDGYCVEKGVIRQFVAMPLGSGYSAEEQITGAAEHGGIQIVVYPMKAEVYERLLRERRACGGPVHEKASAIYLSEPMDMGLAPGGRMRQEIYDDSHGLDVWDREHASRCFVHIANSLVWSSITGSKPPHPAPTAREYTDAGLPWFDYYDDKKALEGSARLGGLESVVRRGERRGEQPLPENESVQVDHVVRLRSRLKQDQVREWSTSS